MPSKISNWLIAVGALVGFAGLCILPAALENHGDNGLLGLGAAVFAMGALTIAAGLYLKAQALRATLSGAPEKAAGGGRRRGACDLCHSDTPAIHCKVHQFHLCGTCLAEHYDFRSCVYVPSTRRVESKTGKSMAANARG